MNSGSRDSENKYAITVHGEKGTSMYENKKPRLFAVWLFYAHTCDTGIAESLKYYGGVVAIAMARSVLQVIC